MTAVGDGQTSVVGRNIVWLLVSQSATWVVSLVLLIVTPELLGPEDFGDYTYAVIFVQYFSLLAGLETGQLLVKLVARDNSVAGPYTTNALALKVVTVAALSAIAMGLAGLMGLDEVIVVLIGVGCLGMLFANLNHVLASALSGLHRMTKPAMWMVVQLYVGGLLGIVVLLLGHGVVAFALVLALANLIPLVANYRTVRPMLRSHWDLHPGVWRRLIGGSLPLVMLTGFNQFYGSIDFIILEQLTNSRTVGLYGVAYRWAGIPLFICTAVIAAYFPRFAEHGTTRGPPFARAVNRAIFVTVAISAPAAFAISVLADDIIRLFSGPKFADAVPALRILALQIPIAAVDTILGTALVASDRVRRYLFVAGAACVLTPIALVMTINAIIDDGGNAATGAALITTFTEIFVLCGALVLRGHGVLDGPTAWRCVRALAAGAAVVPVLLVAEGLPLLVKVPMAMVTFVIAAWALRVVSPEEMREARALLAGIMRRRTRAAMSDATTEESDA